MCAQYQHVEKSKYGSLIIYIAVIALGIFSGLSGISFLLSAGELISELFIRLFRCISLPIIALSIIVTLSKYTADTSMGSIWRRTLLYTVVTTIIAASLSCVLYMILSPANVHLLAAGATAPAGTQVDYFKHVANLIPSNILSPFLEHQVMGVLLVGASIGLAIRFIPDQEAKAAVTQFFSGAHGIFIVITKWIVAIIPIGLFGFITQTVAELQHGMALGGIGTYLTVIVAANLLQGFVVLPIWLKWNGISPFKTMKGMLPALSVAFFSKSSAGTLPVTMDKAEKNLGIKPQVSRFVLPLCTTINMNGCAAFIFATVVYLMQNNGMELSAGMMLVWIGISTLAAVGNAGVPMGCFFLSASLLASMDVPIVLLGLILPFYGIIDMIETALNVWSDSCVAKVVDVKS